MFKSETELFAFLFAFMSSGNSWLALGKIEGQTGSVSIVEAISLGEGKL